MQFSHFIPLGCMSKILLILEIKEREPGNYMFCLDIHRIFNNITRK